MTQRALTITENGHIVGHSSMTPERSATNGNDSGCIVQRV
jgi:hypothetical protein